MDKITKTYGHTRLVQKVPIMDLLSSEYANSRLHNTVLKVLFLGNLPSAEAPLGIIFWNAQRVVLGSFASSMLLKCCPFS
jgi:hypothetical protein